MARMPRIHSTSSPMNQVSMDVALQGRLREREVELVETKRLKKWENDHQPNCNVTAGRN